MILLLVLAQVLVIGLGPLRLPDGVAGKLVKGLPKKLGADKPEMHPFGVATSLLHGGDAAVALHFVSTLIAVTKGPKRYQQTRCQERPGTRQRREQRPGMGLYQLRDALIEGGNIAAQRG